MMMNSKTDREILEELPELGAAVIGVTRKAMAGSLDPEGFALQSLEEMEETLILLANTKVLLDEVEISPQWRTVIADLFDRLGGQMRTVIDFDLLQKIKCLDNRRDADFDDFGPNTCCDYVDSLVREGGRYGVVVFVEPCGDIIKWAESWEAALDWWIAVFKAQPKDWDYCRAGWHLAELADRNILPDGPQLVWPENATGDLDEEGVAC